MAGIIAAVGRDRDQRVEYGCTRCATLRAGSAVGGHIGSIASCRDSKWVARAWPQFRPIAITTAIIIIAMLMVFDIDFYFNESADNYYLGGGNAYTAMYIVDYLEQQQNPHPIVYFSAGPAWAILSISSIPLSGPYAEGIDVNEPATNHQIGS